MEIGKLIYISGKYTKPDYIDLHLQIDSPQKKWDKAIDIFDDRIGGRFFRPIDDLLKSQRVNLDPSKLEFFKAETGTISKNSYRLYPNEADLIPNGFAVMALICLLMETLMQFREGLPVTPRGKNSIWYTKFLKQNLGFSPSHADRFYSDIRCGIIHSGETKKFSCLSIDQENIITPKRGGSNSPIKVDVKLLADKLRDYYEKYCTALQEGKDSSLRVKFIRKMDSITKKWENHQKLNSLWSAIRAQQGRILRDSSQNVFSIVSSNNKTLKLDNEDTVHRNDISEAVYFWNDKHAINIESNWKYMVPLFEACRAEADQFIVRAG